MEESFFTLKWQTGRADARAVVMLDQRLLPTREVYRTYTNYQGVARAIDGFCAIRMMPYDSSYITECLLKLQQTMHLQFSKKQLQNMADLHQF